MSRRSVVLLVALLLAAAASLSVWRYLETVEQDVRADIAEVTVYRATALIETGTDGPTAFSSISPGSALAESVAFEGSTILCTGPAENETDVDPDVCASNPSDLQALLTGTVAAGPIAVGQLITQENFVTQAELDVDALSGQVPAGKVGIAISPGDVGSVAGLIVPGDRVNVLATASIDQSAIKALLADPETRQLVLDTGLLSSALITPPTPPAPELDEDGEPIPVPEPEEQDDLLSRYIAALPETLQFTRTILQNVPVLAVGGQTADSSTLDTAPTGETTVVLEVTPLDAERIELARQVSVLSLTLLPSGPEYTEVDPPGARLDDLFDVLARLTDELEQFDVE